MRSHDQIITDAGGPAALAQTLAPRLDVTPEKLRERTKAWKRENSIPGDYWSLLEELGVAPLDELAAHAAARLPTLTPDPAQDAAA